MSTESINLWLLYVKLSIRTFIKLIQYVQLNLVVTSSDICVAWTFFSFNFICINHWNYADVSNKTEYDLVSDNFLKYIWLEIIYGWYVKLTIITLIRFIQYYCYISMLWGLSCFVRVIIWCNWFVLFMSYYIRLNCRVRFNCFINFFMCILHCWTHTYAPLTHTHTHTLSLSLSLWIKTFVLFVRLISHGCSFSFDLSCE